MDNDLYHRVTETVALGIEEVYHGHGWGQENMLCLIQRSDDESTDSSGILCHELEGGRALINDNPPAEGLRRIIDALRKGFETPKDDQYFGVAFLYEAWAVKAKDLSSTDYKRGTATNHPKRIEIRGVYVQPAYGEGLSVTRFRDEEPEIERGAEGLIPAALDELSQVIAEKMK